MPEQFPLTIPTHVGYILDGNRRWARSHGIPTYEGHLAGYNSLKDVLFESFDRGIKYVSIYAFSSENWKRGEGEVGKLMRLSMQVFKTDLKLFHEREIRIRVMGVEDGLKSELVDAARKAEAATKDNTGGTLCICFNYGGRREIADAAKRCVEDGLDASEITEEAIAERMYAPDVPDMDVIVRTSNEMRLSNFMLWRSAYSEFIFLEKYWPDMRPSDVAAIIETYNERSRRFGG